MRRKLMQMILLLMFGLLLNTGGYSQSQGVTYQGFLKFNGVPANGNYDFEVAVYDQAQGGNQIGGPYGPLALPVTNGVFVFDNIPISHAVFNTANRRWLEIRVRPSLTGQFTTLTPRQEFMRVPFSSRSEFAVTATNAGNANTVGGLDPNDLIQNTTTTQTNSNFAISGTGTANLFNAQSQFNIGGQRVLSLPNSSTNTSVGVNANVNSGVTNSTALGNGAVATANNTVVLGRTSERVIVPGSMTIGNQTTGRGELSIYPSGTNADLYLQGLGVNSGINIAAAPDTSTDSSELVVSKFNGITHSEIMSATESLTVVSTPVWVLGSVRFRPISPGMSTTFPLCQYIFSGDQSGLSDCSSSSIRYKDDVVNLGYGLDLIQRLRPVSFKWKGDGQTDIGLIAEEVSQIEPFLVTHNKAGDIEGVRYDRLGVILVNAVKEQQEQIERQQKELEEQREIAEKQRREIDELKRLVCSQNTKAALCRKGK